MDEGKQIPFPKARVADSMEAAVAILAQSEDVDQRLGLETLKRAKTAGCGAFRGSRVYVDELLVWWSECGEMLPTGNSEIDAVTLELAREKLRKARFANDIEEGRYILKEDQAHRLLALGLELKSILRKRLEEEWPDRLANRSRVEIVTLNRQLVDELCREFAEGTERWSK